MSKFEAFDRRVFRFGQLLARHLLFGENAFRGLVRALLFFLVASLPIRVGLGGDSYSFVTFLLRPQITLHTSEVVLVLEHRVFLG